MLLINHVEYKYYHKYQYYHTKSTLKKTLTCKKKKGACKTNPINNGDVCNTALCVMRDSIRYKNTLNIEINSSSSVLKINGVGLTLHLFIILFF